jgi:hypothetical protein
MTSTQTELLHAHCRLGHIGFTLLRNHACHNCLGLTPAHANCACLFGAARRHDRAKSKPGSIKRSATEPGDLVCVDHMVVCIPGHISFLTGPILGQNIRYYTLWVDVLSHFLYGTLDEKNDAPSAIRSKTSSNNSLHDSIALSPTSAPTKRAPSYLVPFRRILLPTNRLTLSLLRAFISKTAQSNATYSYDVAPRHESLGRH